MLLGHTRLQQAILLANMVRHSLKFVLVPQAVSKCVAAILLRLQTYVNFVDCVHVDVFKIVHLRSRNGI